MQCSIAGERTSLEQPDIRWPMHKRAGEHTKPCVTPRQARSCSRAGPYQIGGGHDGQQRARLLLLLLGVHWVQHKIAAEPRLPPKSKEAHSRQHTCEGASTRPLRAAFCNDMCKLFRMHASRNKGIRVDACWPAGAAVSSCR